MYDFTGYYDVCTMGGEVSHPRRTIPLSCITTCGVVLLVYMLTYVAVVGFLPWYAERSLRPLVISHAFSRLLTSSHVFSRLLTPSHAFLRYGEGGFVARALAEEDSSAYIMATFAEQLAGRGFAIFFTLVVAVVIFGSVLSML